MLFGTLSGSPPPLEAFLGNSLSILKTLTEVIAGLAIGVLNQFLQVKNHFIIRVQSLT